MRTQFIKDAIPIQQKGRRRSIHLQERVEKKLNKLMDQKHIVILNRCSDKHLTSPNVITVEKDQTFKLALDSKKVNDFIHKNKYQMSKIDLPLDNNAQIVKSNSKEQTLFSTRDLRYAHWQIPSDKLEIKAILASSKAAPLGHLFQKEICGLTVCQHNSRNQ